MAAATTIILVAGLIISAATATYSIVKQNQAAAEAKKRAKQQEALALEQSELERQRGAREAEMIRRRGAILMGTQQAQLAGSGILLGEGGTPETILTETSRLAEADALTALADSEARARQIRAQGGVAADEYRSAASAYKSQSIGTAISFAGTAVGVGGQLANRQPANTTLTGAPGDSLLAERSNLSRPISLTGSPGTGGRRIALA